MPSSLAVIGKQTTGYASSKTLPKLRNVLSSFISLPQQETGNLSTDNWKNLFIVLYVIHLIDPARITKKVFE